MVIVELECVRVCSRIARLFVCVDEVTWRYRDTARSMSVASASHVLVLDSEEVTATANEVMYVRDVGGVRCTRVVRGRSDCYSQRGYVCP